MTNTSIAYEFYQFMTEKNVLIAFTGHFDHLVTTSLLKYVRVKLKEVNSDPAIERKIYSILVESIENVSKYSAKSSNEPIIAMLLLCKSDTHFTIITGNHLLNSDIPILREKLDKVLKYSPVELKKMYREQILSQRTHENSAGLGIIDIAIKSNNQIQYNFKLSTDDTSIYLFQTQINIFDK